MNSKAIWNDQIPERDGIKTPINDIAISPDGARVIVAVGNRVLLYKSDNGDLIESLRGHKETVYSVSFSSDGSRFASGGADNIVVIWKITGQGLLRYNHTAPIQRVVYNPSILLLASCSEVDFGLWTPDQKQVTKEKMPSRILSAAWSSDGSMLAIGMLNGMVSLRNQQAQEIMKLDKKGPVWCLTFIPDTSPQKAANSLPTAQSGQNTSTPSSSTDNNDFLAIGCWDKTYSLYKINGNNNNKLLTEKQLSYFPCSMSYSSNQTSKSNYLVITGSNKKATLHSKEGVKLTEIFEKESWVWCCDCHGESDMVAVGSDTGSIDFFNLNFGVLHALFRDRYAFRENLTEVIVHHLVTDKKVRIKCKDLIRAISIYKNKLAVQLSDRICVYESSADNSEDMHFRLRKEKILIKQQNQQTNTLMCITSSHLLFANHSVVELYSFDGHRQKLWDLSSPVTCLRVEGGLEGREGILVGLGGGGVVRLFVDNPFAMELTKQQTAIQMVDINIYRTLLATVDNNNSLTVTDLRTQQVLFTTPGVVSVCFNSEVEDLMCVTNTDSSISVITGVSSISNNNNNNNNSPEQQDQHISGMALGFRGQKIFCLSRGQVTGVDVPQGLNIQRALDSNNNNNIASAYRIACLGATEADWKLLGMRSLRANNLSVAKNAFARLKDIKFLSLIDNIERRNNNNNTTTTASSSSSAAPSTSGRNRLLTTTNNNNNTNNPSPTISSPPLDPTWLAELMAYEGHHQEAAKIYARAGKLDEAIRLFTDLRRWEDAKMFARNAGQVDVSALTIQQARWLQEISDWRGASEMFMSMGQFLQAAKTIAESQDVGWQEALIEVVRACPVETSADTLDYCGDKFSSSLDISDVSFARETFTKAKDVSRLMSLYAKKQMWNEAAKLADENDGKFDVSVFLPYAEWLVSQDRYEEAMQAFKKSRRPDLAKRVLEELTNNAVSECRFKDAAYYFWMLSKETEIETEEDNNNNSTKKLVCQKQHEYEHKADLYFAYSNIHSYVTDPFTSLQPEMLFQVSRFIVNSLGSAEVIPSGLSKAATIYTLARQAMSLGAYKLARHVYDRLSKMQIPERKLEEVEIDMLLVQAKPVRDDPDHLPVCYRCGTTNPLLNPFTNKFAKGDVCTNCGHPFVRSFINFDVLPLVEFVPEPSISDEDAIDMIRQPPNSTNNNSNNNHDKKISSKQKSTSKLGGGWRESKEGNSDMLVMDNDNNNEEEEKNNNNNKRGGDSRRRTELDDEEEDAINEALGINANESDLFTRCLNLTLERQKNVYTPVKVDTNTLLAMKRAEVFVCRPSSKSKRATFYRNMLPEIPIAISQPCHRFFHLEDFEFAYLSEQKCPYSRLKSVGEYGSL